MLNIETPEDFLFEDETEMERYLRSILSIDLDCKVIFFFIFDVCD